jgi:anti-sigma regulatory factor (Ser/Thr protein kinase)
MGIATSFVLEVEDTSAVAELRRRATFLAAQLGFDETDVGRVALVVTESASNLVKHAVGGEILVRSCPTGAGAGLEVLTLDRGPGIPDLDAAVRDGYSSAGTSGTGLGALRRASSELDVYSGRTGTVLLAVVRARSRASLGRRPGLRVSGVSVARPGEEVCGDAWADRETADHHRVLVVVDGLGHGPAAAEAAQEAVRLFGEDDCPWQPAAVLERLHRGLRPTRGAAAAVVAIGPGPGLVYAGVGNIAGVVLGGERPRALVSSNGTLGHEVRRIQAFTYPWPAGSTLVLHSDGLASQWDLDAYPGLIRHGPAVIAGTLYRDFRRRHDDVTVVVARSGTP